MKLSEAFAADREWFRNEFRRSTETKRRIAFETHPFLRRPGLVQSDATVLIVAPRAIEHLTQLRSYVAGDNPQGANRIAGTLLDAVERLAELPNLGRPGRVAGNRELVDRTH